jgi:hypothetical protein
VWLSIVVGHLHISFPSHPCCSRRCWDRNLHPWVGNCNLSFRERPAGETHTWWVVLTPHDYDVTLVVYFYPEGQTVLYKVVEIQHRIPGLARNLTFTVFYRNCKCRSTVWNSWPRNCKCRSIVWNMTTKSDRVAHPIMVLCWPADVLCVDGLNDLLQKSSHETQNH